MTPSKHIILFKNNVAYIYTCYVKNEITSMNSVFPINLTLIYNIVNTSENVFVLFIF